MEENYTPRQRNRRSERYEAEVPSGPQQGFPQAAYQQPYPQMTPPSQPQPMVYQPPMAPAQPVYQQHGPSGQPMAPTQPMVPPQQTFTPNAAPQVPYARPAAQAPLQPQMQRPQQTPGVQYVARGPQPVRTAYQPPAESPRARQGHGLAREQARTAAQLAREEKRHEREREDPPEKAASAKLPAWLSWGMSLMVIAVMALVAAYALMQAYLTTQENEREAARQAVLNNYHVTEKEDGALSVTWQEAIERYAAQYNLQPAFVTAIIRNESSFRTNAESSVGARGLMQMMPDTAEWIAGKLDDDGYHFDDMWDAETNIRYGCWYLGYLSELFAGDPILTACAYHAGQGEVRSWLGDRSISPDGKTVPLSNIPISETRTYAGRVTQAYGIYQALLYPAAVPADSGAAGPDGR